MTADWALVLALVAGLAIGGGLVAVFLTRSHRLVTEAALASAGADARARLASVDARLAERDRDVHELEERLRSAEDEQRATAEAFNHERVVRARVDAELAEEREKNSDRQTARDELAAHFKALAGDALEASRQRLADQQHGALDLILKPLGEKLAAFEKKVEETYDKEAQQRYSLKEEVLNLQLATAKINQDAIDLTRALKGEAKTRGNWGEVVLERVLERSGLVRGREYFAQPSLKGEDGATLRPDVVIHLPDGKHLVIDSKVSLVAYDRYHSAAHDAERHTHGRAHVDAIREHVRALGGKHYHTSSGVDSPDFVALFMPIEPAFGLATSLEPDLFLDAWDRKIVITTPSNLLAILTTVRTLWQRDKQTRNAIQIAEDSGALHDQFALVLESLNGVGKHLAEAQRAFEQTGKRLSDGKGNLIGRIAKLREMGARTKRELPGPLVGRAMQEEERGSDASPAKLSLVASPGSDPEAR